MVKYIFNDKKINEDTNVIFIDNKTKKMPVNLNQYFSKEEIKLYEKVLKNDLSTKDSISVLTHNSETVLFSFDYTATNREIQKSGAKLAKILFKSKNVSLYANNFDWNIDYFVIGVETGIYRFNKYFTKEVDEKNSKLEKINFISLNESNINKDLDKSLFISKGINYVRDFVNEPSNNLTPEIFAKDLLKLKETGLDIEVLEEKDLKALGFNLLLAVSKGSIEKPKVVVFSWKGNSKKKDYDIALVGKGVTFDSGGLSLKPSNSMDGMHTDMAGAATVSGVMKIASELKINKNILGIVGLVENMPSGNAYKINDIITSMSGQTVEILNTDAEGRLVLADLLTYVQRKYKAKRIVDLATLTGAVAMLFGPVYAGLFSNDKEMDRSLILSGEKTGDRLWSLPLDDYFNKAMDSTYADMQNSGKHRIGGGSTGACFLKRFIEEGTSWAHLDIAGVAREVLDDDLYAKGATGFGVKLLLDYIETI